MTLLEDVEHFVRRHNMADTRFGSEALNDKTFMSRLRKGASPKDETIAKVRAYMADQDARAEACDRRAARSVRQRRSKPDPAPALPAAVIDRSARIAGDPVAAIMLAVGPQDPAEAIALVRKRWPETWKRVVQAARAQRIAPGALMVEAIERGLSV